MPPRLWTRVGASRWPESPYQKPASVIGEIMPAECDYQNTKKCAERSCVYPATRGDYCALCDPEGKEHSLVGSTLEAAVANLRYGSHVPTMTRRAVRRQPQE